MKRHLELDEDDDEFSEPTQRSVVRPKTRPDLDLHRFRQDLAKLGYESESFMPARTGDLVLVQQAAQQEADLRIQRERIEDLESQRRWLWGGLGASAAVLLILAFRKRRTPGAPNLYAPGQLPGKRTAA